MNTLFTPAQMGVISFCASECRRQSSGELSVAWMLRAWNYAATLAGPLSVKHILEIAHWVEPKNRIGTRHVPVTFDDGAVVGWEHIDRQLGHLVEAQDRLTPGEFYDEFEAIHPFVDGNGRTGAILFNLLSGTLDSPRHPGES